MLVIWLLLNIPLLSVLAVGFLTGTLQPFFHDVTFITHFMFGVFITSVLYSGWVSLGIDDLRGQETYMFPENTDALVLSFGRVTEGTRFVMNFLVGLGFVGTVLGVIIGFQSFPTDALSDASRLQEFVKMILTGFSTELHTLIMGLLGKLWLSIVVYYQERTLDYLAIDVLEGRKACED